ncbi:MAG TPA: hypothetical protein VF647_02040 [Longimicrobium sp.]
MALIDRDDAHHSRCVALLGKLPPGPLLTTWPCFTEAMYLLGRAGGFPAQDVLWGYVSDNLVMLHPPDEAEQDRIRVLMRQYHDTPMDLADASLVSAAERLSLRRIFTVDRHFRAYRINGMHAFDILP